MVLEALVWSWRRFRPAEGWLPLFLLTAASIVLLAQIAAIKWVPEVQIVWVALFALFLSYLLAQRSVNQYLAWAILLAYGLVLTTLWLGHLWPPLSTVGAGWAASSNYVRQNWGLFIDRMGSWLTAIVRGDQSHETIVFAFGLGLLVWLMVAFVTWSIFRKGRPLVAVGIMVVALAINSYFGRAPLMPVVLFIGLSVLLVTSSFLTNLEDRWERTGLDYSAEIRLDLLIYSGAIALVVMTSAFLLPSIKVDAFYQSLLNRPAVHQIEEALEQAFAGVRSPRSGRNGVGLEGGSGGGQLPRSFLIGGAPELYETVVMTASIEGELPSPSHWRGLSYDVYTGLGWALTEERQETVAAGETIRLAEMEAIEQLGQSVHWVEGSLLTRYTVGQASRFDQDVTTFWRGVEDLSRIQGRGNDYSAESFISVASPSQLRSALQERVPAEIMARYTSLPETVPMRVHELARQVAGDPSETEPFDQVKALESFLRQYPYTLDIEAPPRGVDPVDHFLFESQTGYCDYYASAMVVMARSLALPARLATGYLAQPANDEGKQTIRQINAHSWAEVYFAGFGWVEFEPTAAFPTAEAAETEADARESNENLAISETALPPIPVSPDRRLFLWWLLPALVVVLGALIFWYRLATKPQRADGILWAYDKLQQYARRLGQPTPPSQTPQEFQAALLDQVELNELYTEIRLVTNSFIRRQYSGQKAQPEQAVESWKRIRRRFWLLAFWLKVKRFFLRK
jgi:transglutaminase-like putative cysteine protease